MSIYGGRFGSDRLQGIDYNRMREYRVARTKKIMTEFDIGTLVTWEPWDIRYITGMYVTVPTRWTESHVAILARNDDPYVCAGPLTDPDEFPWLKGKLFHPRGSAGKMAFTPEPFDLMAEDIYNFMCERGLEKEAVGIEGTQSEIMLFDALKRKGLKPVPAREAMFRARMIKNEDEIECVRLACASAEAALDEIKRAIRPGVTECELVGAGMKRLYELGSDETQEFVCSSGPRTNPLHIDYTDRQVRPGELVVVDINGNSWNAYKSCYYRTFCCGKASQEQKDCHKIARDMMYSGMSKIKAGNTIEDVCSGFPDSPKVWGYDDWSGISPGWAMGHGIGISLHELPFFFITEFRGDPAKQSKPAVLEEGMVLAVETWFGNRDSKAGGVRLEENLVVTKDGYELLTLYPVDELIECDI